jgi:hypothetical protein
MKLSRGWQKAVASLVTVAFSFICLIVAPVQAAMVDTASILHQHSNDLARQKVQQFMERQDVTRQFQAWGVDADEARARVASLNDQEINMLASKINEMPAGGDGLGVLLAIAVVAFVVLIILDIVGVTDVFTFIKK